MLKVRLTGLQRDTNLIFVRYIVKHNLPRMWFLVFQIYILACDRYSEAFLPAKL